MKDKNPGNDSDASGYLHLKTPEALENSPEIAGMGARAHAFIIDWHIRLLLALAWLVGASLTLDSMEGVRLLFNYEFNSPAALFLLIPAGLIYFFYHPVLEILMAGLSPGKRMAGVRIVTLQGQTPGIGALLLRNAFRLVDALPVFYILGLVTVSLTRNQVRIGDLAAGLVLVYDNKVSPETLQQMTDLEQYSRLSANDLILLLDLLKRWHELSTDARICLAHQFFTRIGMDAPILSASKKSQCEILKSSLEYLLKMTDSKQSA